MPCPQPASARDSCQAFTRRTEWPHAIVPSLLFCIPVHSCTLISASEWRPATSTLALPTMRLSLRQEGQVAGPSLHRAALRSPPAHSCNGGLVAAAKPTCRTAEGEHYSGLRTPQAAIHHMQGAAFSFNLSCLLLLWELAALQANCTG